MNFNGLIFGIPREILSGERRVAAIPETVRKETYDFLRERIEELSKLR